MSDTDRMYRLLRQRGSRGAHTLELRDMGYTGNPSQRASDIEAQYGVEVDRKREKRGKRWGSRYTLVGVGAGTSSGGGVASADSGESISGGRGQAEQSRLQPANATPGEPVRSRSVPSMFDPDVDWDAAA